MDVKVQRAGLRGVMLKDSPGFHLAHRRVVKTIRADPLLPQQSRPPATTPRNAR